MNTKVKLLVAAAVVTAMAGLAFATPQIDLAAGVLGVGTDPDSIEVHGSAMTSGDRF